jgi:hypothetical protein
MGKDSMVNRTTSSFSGLEGEQAKHQSFFTLVFNDLESLEVDRALKIPLSELPNSGANTVTLLHSEARKKGMHLEMRADRDSLYIWNTPPKSGPS